ncbi:hypothetical protein [Candidatus Venteria ishoeyi]|uniref:Uncharacterized protein n=1 Tax=Candidatus Venteria ishoeyi TaxID=1899563 RepID=A0A1H6F263_9GAMM|nr:hypothetical protein [Candidatus Venteria ishoeyi]SEH04238.1 Uncharacterised protein [Candidatus Venteria ishoeyi]
MKNSLYLGGILLIATSQVMAESCISRYTVDGHLNIPCVDVPGLGIFNVDMVQPSIEEFVFVLNNAVSTTLPEVPDLPVNNADLNLFSLKLNGSVTLNTPSGASISTSCAFDAAQSRLVCPNTFPEYTEGGTWTVSGFNFNGYESGIDYTHFYINHDTNKYMYYDYAQGENFDTNIDKVSFEVPISTQPDTSTPVLTTIENPDAFVANGYTVIIQGSDNISGIKSASIGFKDINDPNSSLYTTSCNPLGNEKFFCSVGTDSYVFSDNLGKTVKVIFQLEDYAGNVKFYGDSETNGFYYGTQINIIQTTLSEPSLASPDLTSTPELKSIQALKTTVVAGEPASFMVTVNTQNGVWNRLSATVSETEGSDSSYIYCDAVSQEQFLCSGSFAPSKPGTWLIKRLRFYNTANSSNNKTYEADSATSNYVYTDSNATPPTVTESGIPALQLNITTATPLTSTQNGIIVNVTGLSIDNAIINNRFATIFIDLNLQ